MRERKHNSESRRGQTVAIRGARCATGPNQSTHASILIDEGRITRILTPASAQSETPDGRTEIDLSGFLLLPGLVNAHDHLDLSLFPRLGCPPHRNYIEWGEEIHRRFPEIIARHRAVPKEVRVWWGGIRNLLCGVTTVCHHNPLLPEMLRDDFPVRLVREYGWGHSVALGGDLRAARAIVPRGRPFIVHACEGVDGQARDELAALDHLGLLDAATVIVHGLAMDSECVSLMRRRDASLILCPSSNQFLFHQLPDLSVLGRIDRLAIGSDSPLTAEGDLLDEIRFAIGRCRVAPQAAYRMVTTAAAALLRLRNFEGSIKESGVGDLIAIRDDGAHAAERLASLTEDDVELVVIAGQVQLASETILDRLPASQRRRLEPLTIDRVHRWVRAPVKGFLRRTEEVLGNGAVRLGYRFIGVPEAVEAEHAC